MAKVINEYTAIPGVNYTPTNIKDRSANIGTATVSGTTLQVSNMTMTSLSNGIGENHYRLFDLWHSSNVNKYSKFGPYTRLVISGVLQTITPQPGSPALMGSFAGYNHSAIAPKCTGNNVSEGGTVSVSGCAGSTLYASVSLKIHLGEIDWYELKNNISYMKVYFKDGNGVLQESTGAITLNSSNFFKTDGDLTYNININFSSTVSTTKSLYATYVFFDSGNYEIIRTTESFNFNVKFTILPYGLAIPIIESNTYFDEVAYDSAVLEDGNLIRYAGFRTLENGSCVNAQIETYIAYDDSTAWEKYNCNDDFSCTAPYDNHIINLDSSRVSCGTIMKVMFRHYNLLDCPATIPF